MTIRFRLALMLLVGGIALAGLLTVGIFSHANSRAVARNLAEQVLGKLAIGIEGQTEKLLGDADAHCQLTSDLLNAGQLKIGDFTQLVTYWSAVLRADPDVTSFYLAEEATGEAVGVNRLRDNEKFWVWQTTKDLAQDRFELSEFLAADYPRHAVHVDSSGPDLRQRHWYLSARHHELGFWTNTYVFLGLKDLPNVLGVSFVLPLRAADGKLSGVMTADFDLSALSRFLAHLQVGETGSAFILERNEGPQLYVVAHPQANSLLVDDESNQGKKCLTPVHQFPDPRVRAFAEKLPATLELEHYPEAGDIEFSVEGQRYLGTYRRIIDPHQPQWVICTFLTEDEVMANAHSAFRWTSIVTLAVILLALALSFSLSREVARPLEQLAKELLSAGRLRLDENPKINSFVREVNELAAATKEMKTGLRSFQKFVPADLVRTLLDSGQEAQLGGRREEVAVFFSDIAGFTSTSETLDPEMLVKHLGEYLGALSDEILKLGGTVDKFIGDSVMAFWEASKSNGQHAASACAAAIQCQARLRELRKRWLFEGLPPMETRIGIHTGEAILGNIGSHQRMNFTIIGDTVNLGSRLEGLNKTYQSEILISEHTYQRSKEQIVARPLDWVSVKGRTAPVLVYELLGMRSQLPPASLEFVERYGEALNDYRARRWSDCIEQLEEILRLCDDDWPATVLKGRCYEYLSDPPPADWDGVLHLTEK